MANEGESSHPKGISLKQAYEMRRGKAITELQQQVRKLIMQLGGLKDLFLLNAEATVIASLMLAPSTPPTYLLMKALMMRVKVLEEEGIQQVPLVTSTLRHPSLMTTLKRKIILIG